MKAALRDPFLALPLDGVRLIEASAGTGKTFTLATLVTRLVVERGLRVGEILAVTFTDAATQELRKRIRERLQLAHDLLDRAPERDEPGEAALTRAVLDAHRARGTESGDALRARLRQAVLDTDLAAIFTIHGFCARVLREHALETGHGLDATELADERELREALAADLWRAHAADDDATDDLFALWPDGHAMLADDLGRLLEDIPLLPADAPLPPDPAFAVHGTGAALVDAFHVHHAAFRDALRAAVTGRVLNGNSYRLDWIEPLFDSLAGWCAAGDFRVAPDRRIGMLTAAAMRAKANKGRQDEVPESPLCDAIDAHLAAREQRAEFLERRRLARLHRIRADARMRMAEHKRALRVHTHDDLIADVADALAGPRADALARALRAQYAVALVDEFQDTDPRQWSIFERVFGSRSGAPALFLIGDPKQAIYGFRGGDVHTYLAAAEVADRAPPLSHNFRSRPSLLAAIAALYRNAGDAAFGDERIRFFAVQPGGRRSDDDFRRTRKSAPALTVWQAPATGEVRANGEPTTWSAEASRTHATRACVAAIHEVLAAARDGKAMIGDRPVRAGDIAVLARTHGEATRVQRALALAGIPAVAAGKRSLFATEEAHEVHALLLALLHAGDDARLRAALATVLVGEDAQAIAALDTDGERHRRWHAAAQGWRERVEDARGGPLALIGDLCAGHAGRLLGLLDGERRIANYLQLAEMLQEARRDTLGLRGLVEWLARRIAHADADDETQLLRLESDARRVQIVTLHKSKGLEYPLVFLPFIGIGRRAASPGRCCVVHDEHGRRMLRWRFGRIDAAQWEAAAHQWRRERDNEDARLLYVGLTRAEHALWIASGPLHAHADTPLAAMLDDRRALSAAGVVFDERQPQETPARLAPESGAAVPPAREARRPLANDWWVYSFSQLAKSGSTSPADIASAATLPPGGGADEPDAMPDAGEDDARFSGNRYGLALHAALEHADFAAWREWREGDPAPAAEAALLADALGGEGYDAAAIEDGIALTTRLIGRTLTVALPEGTRLCDVPPGERRAEIEFEFALQPVAVDALLALLHAHGIARARDRFGMRQRLEGLMTGLIDLVYRHDGRWYVLDYKSNRLPAYDQPALAEAMAQSEYDVQALLYTVALHRWLRFRLGDGYDYARDFGGIRYLFCRGLDPSRTPSPGIHAARFAPELVHALDVLFGHPPGDAA